MAASDDDSASLPPGGVQLVENALLGQLLARTHGVLKAHLIDLSGCRDKRALMAVLAARLNLPARFGANWDALADCLRDLVMAAPAHGCALVLAHAGALREEAPADFDRLLAMLDDVAGFADTQRRRLLALVGIDSTEPHP